MRSTNLTVLKRLPGSRSDHEPARSAILLARPTLSPTLLAEIVRDNAWLGKLGSDREWRDGRAGVADDHHEYLDYMINLR